jgi:hypothetical protein
MTKQIDVETRTMFSLTHFTHHSTLTNKEEKKKEDESSLSMRAHIRV